MKPEFKQRASSASLSHGLLGFFISLCSGRSEPRQAMTEILQAALHPPDNRKDGHSLADSHSANSPRIVHPSACIKAILWPLGRPLEGSRQRGWPNGWLLPRSPERKHLPLPIWLVARTWLCIVPSAKPLDSRILQQSAILLIEISALLRGKRGKGHPDPRTSRHSVARNYRISEACRRYREAAGLEPAILDRKAMVESSLISSPNVKAMARRGKAEIQQTASSASLSASCSWLGFWDSSCS